MCPLHLVLVFSVVKGRGVLSIKIHSGDCKSLEHIRYEIGSLSLYRSLRSCSCLAPRQGLLVHIIVWRLQHCGHITDLVKLQGWITTSRPEVLNHSNFATL